MNIRPRLAVSVFVAIFLLALVWFAHRANVAEEALKALPVMRPPHNPEAWMVVGQEKAISDYETMRLLEVNGSVMGFTGTECLLYTNSAYRTSQLICSK